LFSSEVRRSLFAGAVGGLGAIAGLALISLLQGSGIAPTNTVSLSTGVTGVLPIANGGTSQATAVAAFSALSPITTQDDLIRGNASGAPIRMGGPPADGQHFALQSDGPGSLTWAPINTTQLGPAGVAAASLNFGSIADGACYALTMALTGALTTDVVAPGWPSSLEAGLFGVMFVSAADTITVRLCNLSGAAVDPAAQTFRARLLRVLP
jgi:hypothetical protein